MTTKQIIVNFYFIGVSLLLASSCEQDRAIDLDPEIKNITDGDLHTWLKTAPFNGYWDLRGENSDGVVITNVQEVFPFVGKFKDAIGSYKTDPYVEGSYIYKENTVVFKDNLWGETVLHAKLLFEPKKLYLSASYSEGANIAFTGTSNLDKRYYASLSETRVTVDNENYKTGIYWISTNNQRYLSGYYQKSQLAFQFAFPFKDSLASIKKVEQISKSMKLNITEWETLEISDLKINKKPISFWKDPFMGFYKTQFLPQLQLKLKDTDYVVASSGDAAARNVDYLFTKPNSSSKFTINKSVNPVDKKAFEEQMKDVLKIENEFLNIVYLPKNKDYTMKAIILIKDNSKVEITAMLDPTVKNDKTEFQEIIETLKVRKF